MKPTQQQVLYMVHKQDFDQLDIVLGKEFFPMKNLMLAPKRGMRAFWTKNDLDITLTRTQRGSTVKTYPPYNTDFQDLNSKLNSLS